MYKRQPPTRLGLRLNSQWGDNWTASLEYARVWAQNRTAVSQFPRERDDEDDEDEDEDNPKPRQQKLYAEPVLEDPTSGYHLLNAGIAYRKRIGKADYRVSLDAFNLLNKKVYIHNSHLPYVPRPGRNFVFGVNVSF